MKRNRWVKQMNSFNMKSTDVLVGHRNDNPVSNTREDVSFFLPTVYLMQNTLYSTKFSPLLLPVCTVATAVKAMCKCRGRIQGSHGCLVGCDAVQFGRSPLTIRRNILTLFSRYENKPNKEPAICCLAYSSA